MRKLSLVMAVVAGIWAVPGRAEATATLCPDPTATFQYGVDPGGALTATCLAYGDQVNIGQGGGNDGFLNPTADTHVVNAYTPSDYTLVGDITGGEGGQTSGTYSFSGLANTKYVLGVSDGTDPKWAAFLLPLNDFAGTWTISGGRSLSHLVLYQGPTSTGTGSGSGSGQELTPEPASLLLLGSGLSAIAMRVRRRKKQAV